MFSRTAAAGLLLVGLFGFTLDTQALAPTPLSKADKLKAKKALQDVQEYIGQWNVEGVQKNAGKTEAWKEKVEWSWKFDKEDKDSAWLVLKIEKGKHFSGGTMKYLPAKKKYELTLTPVDTTLPPRVFEGDLARGTFTFTRKDETTGDVYRFKMNTAAEGIRILAQLEKQDKGRGPFTEVFKQTGTKEGESFAGGAKKPECIVTGGAGTIAVSFGGKTYYVCCSGCRDEFNANPAKFVAEAAKKK